MYRHRFFAAAAHIVRLCRSVFPSKIIIHSLPSNKGKRAHRPSLRPSQKREPHPPPSRATGTTAVRLALLFVLYTAVRCLCLASPTSPPCVCPLPRNRIQQRRGPTLPASPTAAAAVRCVALPLSAELTQPHRTVTASSPSHLTLYYCPLGKRLPKHFSPTSPYPPLPYTTWTARRHLTSPAPGRLEPSPTRPADP